MVQLPAAVMWTVVPITVQLPLAVNVTAKPDEAVALTAKSASPYVLFAIAPKVIVCVNCATVSEVLPVKAPDAAVMVVVPGLLAVASPAPVMGATAVLLLLQPNSPESNISTVVVGHPAVLLNPPTT